MSTVVFPSLDAFLASRRIQPRIDGGYMEDSYDFGVNWQGSRRDAYRLTWIGPLGRDRDSAAPGELYLLTFGTGTVELLCVIPPVPPSLGRPDSNVQAILSGWSEVDGPNGIDWIRDRVAEALRAGWAHPAAIHGGVR